LTTLDPAMLRSTFSICASDDTMGDDIGWSTRNWISEALLYMAMGNFPYPSYYILNGAGELPAFPVRVACKPLAQDMTDDDQISNWLEGLASFAGVYYNYTGTLDCNLLSAPVNKESQIVNTLWNYQYCSQIFQVLAQNQNEKDMLWDEPWNGDATAANCLETYRFVPDRYHFSLVYGTPVDWVQEASNIVWSQGEYDPWRGGGVMEDLNDLLRAMVIPKAAHHLDLFFSHEHDTDAVVIEARKFEMGEVRKWVNEKRNTINAKPQTITAETH
jgi:lysosomal Pro-X carboxypeptidase